VSTKHSGNKETVIPTVAMASLSEAVAEVEGPAVDWVVARLQPYTEAKGMMGIWRELLLRMAVTVERRFSAALRLKKEGFSPRGKVRIKARLQPCHRCPFLRAPGADSTFSSHFGTHLMNS